jgi:hypothetical protein
MLFDYFNFFCGNYLLQSGVLLLVGDCLLIQKGSLYSEEITSF